MSAKFFSSYLFIISYAFLSDKPIFISRGPSLLKEKPLVELSIWLELVPKSKRIISNFLSLNFILLTIFSILLNLSFTREKFEYLDSNSLEKIFDIGSLSIANN